MGINPFREKFGIHKHDIRGKEVVKDRDGRQPGDHEKCMILQLYYIRFALFGMEGKY